MPEKRAKQSVAAKDVVVSFRETVTESRKHASTTRQGRTTALYQTTSGMNGRQSNITPGQVSHDLQSVIYCSWL